MRKLAIVCGAFSLAVFLAHYLLPAGWLFPLALALSLPGIGLILLRRRWLLAVILALCGLAAGLYAYGLHRMLTLNRALTLDGSTLCIEARVLTVPESGDGWNRVELRIESGDGKGLRGLLYGSEALLDARPGDRITGEFRFRSADTRYGERYDNDLSRGIILTANVQGELTLLPEGRFSLRGAASSLNAAIGERIGAVFPADTAAFLRALLLGDKSDLYVDDALYLSLSRAGLMHIVAVSGMHVAYLVGMLRQLFGNRRRTAWLAIALVWSFVLLTGGSPSAVRAGLMQSIVLLAPVFGRENDPPTSLLFALALILLVNPFAAGSVSLQLSFTAIAGLLLFADPLKDRLMDALPARLPYFLRNYLASNLGNSLGVLVLSTPLIGLYFGTVSVLSPVTNLLCLWAVPICFGGGLFCCLLSLLSLPAAVFLAKLVAWPARWIVWIAGLLSKQGFSCLYLCLRVNILWVALAYLLFALAFFVRRGGWLRWATAAGLAVASLFALLTATGLYYSRLPGVMTAVDVDQGQSLVVFSGDSTVVVDCGNINSRSDAGDCTGAYLLSRGRPSVDCLALTHLHSDHADGVLRLLEYLPVCEIVLAEGLEDPNGLLPKIRASAEAHGTGLRYIGDDTVLTVGDVRLELFAPGERGEINERCLAVRVGIRDCELLTTGDMNIRAEQELIDTHALRGTELLIVGHHGSKYACGEALLDALGGRTAIISCGLNNFGHPTQETLARLAAAGYTVYRTDEDGTVELRVP